MTRISQTGFAVRWLAVLALIIGPVCLGTHAAPPKPPPGPSGTIYYRKDTTYYAVKPDGSGQAANILPNIGNLTAPSYGDANPAYSPSGGNATQDRWWIYPAMTGDHYAQWINPDGTVTQNLPHWDLFAVRSNPQNRAQLQTVQLTDLYGIARVVGAEACWSNDGNNDLQNSFVTAYVRDIRNGFDPQTTNVDVNLSTGHNLLFPLAISEIQPGYVPFGPHSWAAEAELDAMLWSPVGNTVVGGWGGDLNGQGKFAPSGDLYLRNTAVAQWTTELFIAQWTPTSTGDPWLVLWDGRNGQPQNIWTAQWSPNGQTIAMEVRGAQLTGGDIYTQPASGASAPKKVLSATAKGFTTTIYHTPAWSPDNQYLVVIKEQYNGSTLTGSWLTRLSLSDGKTLDLVPIASGTKLQRWVADQ